MNHIKMIMETQERNSLLGMSNAERDRRLLVTLECQNVLC